LGAALCRKAPLPDEVLRLLVGWLAARISECTQSACWLVVGFFGMLRRSELAALTVGDHDLDVILRNRLGKLSDKVG
jgi:hypothetical protein